MQHSGQVRHAWRMFTVVLLFAWMPSVACSAEMDVPQLSVVWSTDVDGRKPADALSFSAPTITGEGEMSRIVIGGLDARVHVYDMRGKELFRLPLNKNCDSGAATLASGLVVLGDTEGTLYGVDAQKGEVIWQFSLSSPVTGVPLAVGDDVVVQTTDNNLYRIDAKGKKVWSFTSQQGGLSLYLSASPMLHGDHLYALLSNGDAVALDASNGDLTWRKQLLLDTDAALLSELRAPQATPIWLPEWSINGQAMQDVVLFSFYQGDVMALAREDGRTIWTSALPLKSAPLMDAHRLYIADGEGTLKAMSRVSGDPLWSIQLSHGELMGPVKWHDALWLSDNQGQLFRVSMEGKLLGKLALNGSFERLPIVTSQGLLLHHSLGGLYLVHE